MARKATGTVRARAAGAGKAAPAEATPCPRCQAAIPARGERGRCPNCGLAVRFEDAPERPCAACKAPVALLPGAQAVRCAACGAWQAVDPARGVVGRATCPRCRRRIEVPLEAPEADCAHCGSRLQLADGTGYKP